MVKDRLNNPGFLSLQQSKISQVDALSKVVYFVLKHVILHSKFAHRPCATGKVSLEELG